MSVPLVSVITPTWQRHGMLLDACVPSVQAQAWPAVEHVIVSDGPDPELHKALLDQLSQVARCAVPACETWLYELDAHDETPHWGGPARRAAVALARGDLITYCDDDDQLRPMHCTLLAEALIQHPEAGFAVSRMLSHQPGGDVLIGTGDLAAGDVGTPMIMHRRSVLETATWGEPHSFEDWNLVWAWMQAGIGHVRVQAETSDVWPSAFR